MRTTLLLLALVSAQAAVLPDACSLLSQAATEKVMGEDITDRKPTVQNTGSVRSAQCFYTARTFSNSISITLTSALPGTKRDAAKELWRRWFHRGDADGDREKTGTWPAVQRAYPKKKKRPPKRSGRSREWVMKRSGSTAS